jgi:hypothetical protein
LQSTPYKYWQFPNGTDYTILPEGTWYCKVRTKDSDGDWGFFSEPNMFTVDTGIPLSKIIIPINNTFYKILDIIYGNATELKGGTGLDRVEIQIKEFNNNIFWNGSSWVSSEIWLLPDGKEVWSYDASKITWKSGTSYCIRSRAIDIAGNIENPPQKKIITFDYKNPYFSQPIPAPGQSSATEELEVGITILDETSGVKASSVQYSVSTDFGVTWGSWKTVTGLLNNKQVDVILTLTFPNGTSNRIRWRASDVAGNGPTISDEYIVLVNKSLRPDPSEVRLISPKNGSTITTRSIKLNWEILNYKLNDVRFDIYLDTVNPPKYLLLQNYTKVQLEIEDLEHDETYYWSVVPKYKTIIGSCLSGHWSFTIKLPRPKAILKLPINNSKISALKPTLTWSLEYTGSDIIHYNLFFGTTSKPGLMLQKLSYNYYSVESLLGENRTYYWQVVPWAGDLRGYPSEIWSFSIKTIETTPIFALNLTLEPALVTLYPNTEKLVQVRVTNLGTVEDIVSIKLWIPHETGIGAYVNKQDDIEIGSNQQIELILTITATKDAKNDEVEIRVVAISDKAEEFNLSAVDEKLLTVVIKEKEKSEPDEPLIGTDTQIALFIIFVIIIIFISFILILAYLSNRKKEDNDDMNIDEKQILTENAVVEEDQVVDSGVLGVDEEEKKEAEE